MFEKAEKIKETEKGFVYDLGGITYIFRKKGFASADHEHDGEENFILLEGEAELTIGDKTEKITAPKVVSIPSNIYHKLLPLTDVRVIHKK